MMTVWRVSQGLLPLSQSVQVAGLPCHEPVVCVTPAFGLPWQGSHTLTRITSVLAPGHYVCLPVLVIGLCPEPVDTRIQGPGAVRPQAP